MRYICTLKDFIMLLNGLFSLYTIFHEKKEYQDYNYDKKIDNVYVDFYRNINNFFNNRCVFILNRNERLIKHLNLHKNYYMVLKIGKPSNISKIFDLKGVFKNLATYPSNTIFIFLNIEDTSICNYLYKIGHSFYIYEDILTNQPCTNKNYAIMKICLDLKEKTDYKLYDNPYFKNKGIYITESPLLETIFIDIFIYDTCFFINSRYKLNLNIKLVNIPLNFFNDLKNIFEGTKILAYSTMKLDWLNNIISETIKLMLDYNLLLKNINFMHYPEVISMLFPCVFVSSNNISFSSYEIVRFCLSFTYIKDFIEFQKYFNVDLVENFNENLGQIYFSRFV